MATKNDYTTTRENWELRRFMTPTVILAHYTTTRENWELRLGLSTGRKVTDYTTTRENWELRRLEIGMGGR